MDTSSINKLNRYTATLNAITTKDYNENHGPDGRFTSGFGGGEKPRGWKADADPQVPNGHEVVKTVNGYKITRRIGTRGFFSVRTQLFDNGDTAFADFRTIKAATEFCESITPFSKGKKPSYLPGKYGNYKL